MNLITRPTDFPGGMSNTVGFAEVQAYQLYVRTAGGPAALNALRATPVDATALAAGGSQIASVRHTDAL